MWLRADQGRESPSSSPFSKDQRPRLLSFWRLGSLTVAETVIDEENKPAASTPAARDKSPGITSLGPPLAWVRFGQP